MTTTYPSINCFFPLWVASLICVTYNKRTLNYRLFKQWSPELYTCSHHWGLWICLCYLSSSNSGNQCEKGRNNWREKKKKSKNPGSLSFQFAMSFSSREQKRQFQRLKKKRVLKRNLICFKSHEWNKGKSVHHTWLTWLLWVSHQYVDRKKIIGISSLKFLPPASPRRPWGDSDSIWTARAS